MAQPTEEEFAALKADRDTKISKVIGAMLDEMADRQGTPRSDLRVGHINYGGGSTECYCACASGGPCQHEFDGWREFESGGEQVCKRCGMGAMHHTLSFAE
jgi:hypothetical protein